VEEVKRDLADGEKQHLKILSLALDAGFNSKSSFNAIFKKHTGLTPSEYRKKL
jgi:AraC-like DNA-binding protein